MGREARRVPLDFDWPLGEVWEGYLTPERLRALPCPGAGCSSGWSPEGAWLQKIAFLLQESATAHARGEIHPWAQPLRQISYGRDTVDPGPDFVALVSGLTGLSLQDLDQPFGPSVHRVAAALREKAGLPREWETCRTCNGSGGVEAYPGQAAEAEAWTWTEPPTGPGWQMWETTSEGSPTSPVFETPEALADWCTHHTTVFGCTRGTYKTWLRIIKGEEIAHVQIAPGVIAM